MDGLRYKASEKAVEFLKEYLTEAPNAENSYQALKLIYEMIDDKGFEPPKYEKLNDFGLAADEIYLMNNEE